MIKLKVINAIFRKWKIGDVSMESKYEKSRRVYFCVYLIAMAALIVYLLTCTDISDCSNKAKRDLLDFSDGWTANDRMVIDLDEIGEYKFLDEVVLEKTLPDRINPNYLFSMAAANAQIKIFIDGEEVYRFEKGENLTGKGYGIAYHSINLYPEQAGKSILIHFKSPYDNYKIGRIYGPFIGTDESYRCFVVSPIMVASGVAMGVIFMGLVLLTFCLFIPDLRKTSFDLPALATFTLVTGVWMLNDTGVFQFMLGAVEASRVIEHALIHMMIFPLALFIASIMQKKSARYIQGIFIFTVLDIIGFVVMRYGCGIDMAWVLPPLMAIYYGLSFGLMVRMIIEDRKYCRENGIDMDKRMLYFGILCLLVTLIMDSVLYFYGVRSLAGRGLCTRFGFAIFIMLTIIQVAHWWINDKNTANRDRFINEVLQYVVSANDPEKSINILLEYMGKEFNAKRTYIFEGKEGYNFHCTYEWFAEGLSPRPQELREIPYKGMIDDLYEIIKKRHRLIVTERDKSKELNEKFYEVLVANNVETIVTGPLENDGKLLGIFGVDDAPAESLQEIAEIIRLASYFFAQLVLQRENRKLLMMYSYSDPMTGCRNRRALDEFEKYTLNVNEPYGFMICDINGLKKVNDTKGHEAGDAMILAVAECIKRAFGNLNSYRMGGDEFTAYAYGEEALRFFEKVQEFKELMADTGYAVAIGAVLREFGDPNLEKARAEADALMYEDKRKYYQAVGGRRETDL